MSINGSLAFKKFTNNRYNLDLINVGTFQMTQGLTAEELVGIMFPYMGGSGVVVSAFPYPTAEYRDEIIEALVCGATGQIPLYYSIKTGIASTNIDDVISKETPSLGPKPYVLDKGLTLEQLKDKDLGDGKSITNAEHAEGDPDYIYQCTLSDDSTWYYNSNTGKLATTIEGTNA